MTKVYKGTFLKKNNDVRTMMFTKLEDLPKDFLESKIKGHLGEVKNNLAEGYELVWDTENDDFRVFNWTTAVGDVREVATASEKKVEANEKKSLTG